MCDCTPLRERPIFCIPMYRCTCLLNGVQNCIKYLVTNARNVELFFEVSLCVPEDAFEELPHPPAHSDATIKTDIITKQLKK